MNRIQSILAIVICYTVNVQAQDTLLFEGFDVDPSAMQAQFPSGTTNDPMWTNFDADGIMAANSRPGDWFWDAGFANVDSSERLFISSSWLVGFSPDNRNWLMTPALAIPDTTAELSWRSATFQFPLYLDGYTVLVSTTNNNESSFTDTIFQAAGYDSLPPGADPFVISNYYFTAGYVHGGGNTAGPYFEYDPTADSSRWSGVLEPHSISLAAYAGQTIYITFLHDSEDDNLIGIDDILVSTAGIVGVQEVNESLELSVFPNPSSDMVLINYTMPFSSTVSIKLINMQGQIVHSSYEGVRIKGLHTSEIEVHGYRKGQYTLQVETPYGVYSKALLIP